MGKSIRNAVLAAILLLSVFGTGIAQPPPQPRLQLLGVSVAGNKNADSGLIIATSGLVQGQPVTGEKIQGAIRRLWDLELFSDVKIVADQMTGAGVFLQIQVKEYPRLEMIDIGGGKKIGHKEVEDAIDLNKGQVLRPSDPIRMKRKLKKLCDDKGYLLADIQTEIHDGSSPGLAILYIRVNDGTKVKIDNISFTGNEAFTDRKLRGQMNDTKESMWIFRSGEFHNDKFDADKKAIIGFYRENGYRDAQVVSDSIWYSEDLKWMNLRIDLKEGPKYYFGPVTFSGSDLFTENQLRQQVMFRPGDVFDQKKYELTWRERLSSLFYDQGYIYATIRPTETPAGGDTVAINFHIDAGNRFSVNRINIVGNNKTYEKVIRREFSLKPGDTFDVSKLRRSIRDVTILNYFANIQPDVEEVGEDKVDLIVKVEEKPTDQANMSAGYSELDGLIGSIGFAAPNLFGTGQQANFDWNFGQTYGSFSLSYTEPWFLDTETLLGGSFYIIKRRWSDGFTENLTGGSVRTGKRLYWPDDYFRGDWIYRIEKSKFTDFSDEYRARTDRTIEEGETRISSSVTQVISRDSRDAPEFPTSGSVFRLTSQLAGGPLGGDDKFHKHTLDVEWYSNLHPKVVLFNNFTLGAMGRLTNRKADIPLLDYFYMGGSGLSIGTPLRGYEERTVGPISSDGTTTQGSLSELKFGTELRVLAVENPTIYALGFAEAGNCWLTLAQTDPSQLYRSAGVGVRLFMPLVGMIGLDFGYGLDHFDATGRRRGEWHTHFQFGRQF